ncbi:MAG: ferrochelatase, partial [Longimicrobiales bacterium]
MRIAVMLLNFGEPEHATEAEVLPFLERIFLMNGELEGRLGVDAAHERARELAAARAPGLIAEYQEIGGSPLNSQAHAQALALQAELQQRGHDALCYVGMQFTEPSIDEAVGRAHADGCDVVVGLPVYPLCGTSTTILSLRMLSDALQRAGWMAERREISGWHRHPLYIELRAQGIRDLMAERGESFDRGCRLVFSAHGIP